MQSSFHITGNNVHVYVNVGVCVLSQYILQNICMPSAKIKNFIKLGLTFNVK